MSAQARLLSAGGGQTVSAADTGPTGWLLAGVVACFVLSGLAALIYQTAWLRQFSLVFGTAELAVATVLAAYMGGLAVGAAMVTRWLRQIRRPLLAYAGCELGIAITALAVPLLLSVLEWLLVTILGHRAEPPASQEFGNSLFTMAGAFVALGLPTALMGATLPLLTRFAVHSDRQIGRRVGLLYGSNTAGAAAGALAAGFWLLPRFGLAATVWVGVTVNLIVFAVALLLARRSKQSPLLGQPATADHGMARLTLARGPAWILPIMLLSGGVTFVYEVLWTRMLGHVLGSSIFAFATMLASVLTGIALGGALAASIARDRRICAYSFAIVQFVIAAAAAFIYSNLEHWVPAEGGLKHHAWLAIVLLLPATLAIGATYPFAVRVLADDGASAASAAARVYSWNTVGAVFGALLAGLAVLPALRYEGTAQYAIGANLVLALATLVLVVRARLPWLISALTVAIAGFTVFLPPVPERLLFASPLNVGRQGSLRYYVVGRSATVVVLEQDGMLALRTNGLPEALIEMSGTPPKFSGEFWLSPLAAIAMPTTAVPGAKSMLIVGLGGGVVIDGVPPSIQTIDVIEIEPQVLAANRALAGDRKRDPLRDRRLNIILNDARGALALTDKRYDAIVSQPSHPWTAGASHLYTREFMQLARAHLTPQGVFVQWMNIAFLDEALLRSFVATLLDVFPQLEIYRPDPTTLVFVAALAPLDTAVRLAHSSAPISWAPSHYARFGILTVEDVVAALVVDHQSARQLANAAPLITDDRNRLATSSVYEAGRGLNAEATGRLLAPYDPLRRKGSWLSTDAARRLSLPYMARRLALYSRLDATLVGRVEALAAGITDEPTSLYVQAIARTAMGDAPGAQKLLDEAATLAPDNRQILFERLRPQLLALASGSAGPETNRLAARLSGSAAAVADAGRYSASGDWLKLSDLDGTLALANPTDAWYFQALAERAEWRSRVRNPELEPRVGEQCLGLVDQAILSQPAVALFELRARCAAALGRADALIESIFAFALGTRANLYNVPVSEVAALTQHLEELAYVIAGIGQSQAVDQRRLQQVQSLVIDVETLLKARATPSQ